MSSSTSGKYQRLLDHLSKAPLRFRPSEEMDRILDICLDERDVEILLNLGHLPAMHGPSSVARKVGLTTEEADQRLRALASRGAIARARVMGRDLYGLLPIMPGFFEFTFMKDDNYPADVKDELARLWSEYKRKHLTHELTDFPTLPLRVVPVNRSIEPDHRVLLQDDVVRIVDRAGLISLGKCACRTAERKCDNPVEVCFAFNTFASLMIQNGFARKVGADEARDALRRAAEAGLVHAAMNCRTNALILCNCCGCCCVTLSALAKMNKARGVAVSSVRAEIDVERCEGCGSCERRCWVKAVSGQGADRSVRIDKCIGCGACTVTCPTGAIMMRPRPGFTNTAPRGPLGLLFRMTGEREITAELMKALLREMA